MKACELVGVSRRTIYNWIASGKVEYVRTAGGSVRIFVDTLWREPRPRRGADTQRSLMMPAADNRSRAAARRVRRTSACCFIGSTTSSGSSSPTPSCSRRSPPTTGARPRRPGRRERPRRHDDRQRDPLRTDSRHHTLGPWPPIALATHPQPPGCRYGTPFTASHIIASQQRLRQNIDESLRCMPTIWRRSARISAHFTPVHVSSQMRTANSCNGLRRNNCTLVRVSLFVCCDPGIQVALGLTARPRRETRPRSRTQRRLHAAPAPCRQSA